MININLRKAKADEFEFVWNLYSTFVKPLIEPHIDGAWIDKEQKQKFLDKTCSASDTFIIEHEGKSVGWIDYREGGETVEIVNGYIDKAHQRKGIGSAVVTLLKDKNKTILADTIKGNGYNKFFDKLGFETTSEKSILESKQLKS